MNDRRSPTGKSISANSSRLPASRNEPRPDNSQPRRHSPRHRRGRRRIAGPARTALRGDREDTGSAKRQAGDDAGSPMRPGREAIILRRLDGLRRGHLPQALMVRLWRSIMSAATSVQARTTVHISPAIMADPRSRFLRRSNSFRASASRSPTKLRVVAAIAATSPDIAILPRDGIVDRKLRRRLRSVKRR